MNAIYCTPTDLIGYANKARLLSQIASADYGQVPTAEEVLDFFATGAASPDKLVSLQQVKDRVEQVISNSASEINGLLALCGDLARACFSRSAYFFESRNLSGSSATLGVASRSKPSSRICASRVSASIRP